MRLLSKLLLLVSIVLTVSCEKITELPVQFPVNGTQAVLIGIGREAQEGTLYFSSPKNLEYRFDETFNIKPVSSLLIEYEFSLPPSLAVQEKYSLVLNTGTVSWELPMDTDAVYFYFVPIDGSFDGNFSITLEPAEKAEKDSAPVFKIRSLSFTERFFGFQNSTGNTDKQHIIITPFVSRQGSDYVIDVPAAFWPNPSYAGISASFSPAVVTLEFANRRLETFPAAASISISPSLYSEQGRAVLSGAEASSFFLSVSESPLDFPTPIAADPLLVIEWPRENWRNASYEVFRWDRFPSVLIFDYADYNVQARMLKRLAFYVEKAGFRGRLSHDSEIAHLHGWNAHDYRAEDLARFFDTARKTDFPLLDEEWELEQILLNEGIIREVHGSIVPGEGAIISIARESPDYLRYRFMVHEGYHGLFFIDEEYRDFCRRRWEIFPADAKRFLLSYFDYQRYDTNDEYLVVNEFMAHILQQTVSAAADYFGRQLPLILEPTWRASSLPQKNAATGTWPALAAAFTAEAQALSDYVNQRWGLAAGRVWMLRLR